MSRSRLLCLSDALGGSSPSLTSDVRCHIARPPKYMKRKHGLLSEQKPIEQIEYDPLPPEWNRAIKEDRRKISHEKACRDLDKEPDQLLVDIHDESLDKGRSDGETIARAFARMASLELRLDKKAGKLNVIVFSLGLVGVLLALILEFGVKRTVYPEKR